MRAAYCDESYDYCAVYACLSMPEGARIDDEDGCRPGQSRFGFMSRTTEMPNSKIAEIIAALNMSCMTEDALDWNVHSCMFPYLSQMAELEYTCTCTCL